jgi:hypothetical protein
MRWTAIFILCLLPLGCTTTPADLRQSDASVQIPKIEKSVHRNDKASEQQMVHDLCSDDPAIRFYAIQGLYRLTGTTLGYKYYDDEHNREQAILKWEEWLKHKNPKSESRNSKQAQNSNEPMTQTGDRCEFRISNFEFVSDFEIRISNFSSTEQLWL